LTYSGTKSLGVGSNLSFTKAYKVIYTGADYKIMNMDACNIYGDYYPCDSTSLAEIVGMINKWSAGNANLVEVVNLINKWAAGFSA
jgi:hypothetical protein